jgi:hypothetical protein
LLSAKYNNKMKHKTNEMHSGGLALILDSKATWDEFPKRSKFWADKLGAVIIGDSIITVDECILEVKIDGGFFWITYDDFQSSIQLEPKEPEFNKIVLSIQSKLNSGT